MQKPRRTTEAGYVAKLLRAELKEKFPNVKFQVTSKTYSGGDSVDIRYTYEKGVTPKYEEVNLLTHKYEAGKFDGMTDSYEYTNKTTGPTVRYIFVECDYSKHIEAVTPLIMSEWGLTAEDIKDPYVFNKRFNDSFYYFIRREAIKYA